MAHFNAEIFMPPGNADVAVLRLEGSLDAYSLPDLEKKMKQAIAEERHRIIVNCKKLKFLSSPGMGFFLGTLGELEKKGGSIVFVEISQPEVHDAMNLLGFFDVFSVFNDEKEALEKSETK
jgi:anti-sigma B factor antagonist